jgi:hypothetical protein
LQDENHAAPCKKRYEVGIDDAVVVPFALATSIATRVVRVTISILIRILDYAFPIFLQFARFPLFTARIVGDGAAALLKAVVGLLPISGAKREEWGRAISRRWSWLRQKISYSAFEEAVHHAFEAGMAWVFVKCRTLTPRGALLVIAGAILWLPISFGASTIMHAMLIAHATSLPAWMQLLHPLATFVAKSKLLVLPVYPAAWPQAKQHPFVLFILNYYRYMISRPLVQKTRYRYEQIEQALAQTATVVQQSADRLGLRCLSAYLVSSLNVLSIRIADKSRALLMQMLERSCRLPLIGPVVTSYAKHYGRGAETLAEPFSKKASSFFARWSMKFSTEYYDPRQTPGPHPRAPNA